MVLITQEILCGRVNKIDIDSKNQTDDNGDDDDTIIALYSTGIKVTNRGQWMQEK